MGKGKAKGFRPPRSDDANAGMLFGSAAHLTGDTIASPVQLRQEGRALPQGHMNYGDEWGKGKGKGKDGATGANAVPVAPRPKDSSGAFVAPPSAKAGAAPAKEEPTTKAEDADRMPPPATPAVMRASAKGASAAGKAPAQAAPPAAAKAPAQSPEPAAAQARKAEAAPAAAASQPSAPVASDGLSEIQRRRAALAKISQRRAEMLERERASQASQQSSGVVECEAPSSLAVKEEAKEEDDERGGDLEAADGLKDEEAMGDDEEDEDDEVARAAARRRRLEEEEGGGGEEADVKRPRTEEEEGKPQSGAMKQGLQQWAERVNALAAEDEADEDLAQRCRDFVRKRILRAHAEGNLHSVDWSEEPLPTMESLRTSEG